MRLHIFLLILTALAAAPLAGPASAGEDVSKEREVGDQRLTALLEKAAREGRVRVIVGLVIPGGFEPEGELTSPEAVARQRAAIAATRVKLMEMLRGSRAEIYASWDALPTVGLRVDAAALSRLTSSPEVATIQEDSASPAH